MDTPIPTTVEETGTEVLRFITCGSASDGKSTLIQRLLHDSELLFKDQVSALVEDSQRCSADGMDSAVPRDNPEAEHGTVTPVDVGYRSFRTPRRSFMMADAPGHERSVRTIATGAANADLTVILVDARMGLLSQTRRDSFICSLLGIRHAVLAVNKIDLVGYRQEIFERIQADYATFAAELDFASVAAIPISARYGDNVAGRSGNMPWYRGPSLLEYLESVELEDAAAADPPPRPDVSDQFAAHLIWLSEEPLMPGRSYLCRTGANVAPITVTGLKYRIDVDTREHLSAKTLDLNEIAFCNVAVGGSVAFERYAHNRRTGSFVIVDRFTGQIVGAGMIAFALRRGTNIHWQPLLISKARRAALKQQRPAIVWFTGLSGAGKSTIANIVEHKLHAGGYHTMLLDGDNVRHGLNRDLGFTEADRVENIRRAGEVAKLMTEGGLIVLCSFISPYRAERDMVRSLVAEDEFIEVFVDTPIAECVRRDPKGLYAKARAGTIKNLTGFDAPYEVPEAPEISLPTLRQSPEQLAEEVVRALAERGIIKPA